MQIFLDKIKKLHNGKPRKTRDYCNDSLGIFRQLIYTHFCKI